MGCPPFLTLDFTRAMCSSTVVRPTYQIRTSIPSASAFSRSPVIVLPPRVVSNAKSSFSTIARSSRRLPSCQAALFASTRSEEHTSELQSLTNLVCRLLLEKKKQHKQHD